MALFASFPFTVGYAQSGVTPAETKAIAEEAFIYGLPIVMNYAVMYEYAVDRDNRFLAASTGGISRIGHCPFLLATCRRPRRRASRRRQHPDRAADTAVSRYD
jgi:hypothetical protein